MHLTSKQYGNSISIHFTKEFMQRAGIKPNDTLNAEIVDGKIILTPAFRHRSLKERAEEYGGQLNISGEFDWGEPIGREVW